MWGVEGEGSGDVIAAWDSVRPVPAVNISGLPGDCFVRESRGRSLRNSMKQGSSDMTHPDTSSFSTGKYSSEGVWSVQHHMSH